MTIEIRAFDKADYPEARALWEASEGVGLSSADERPAIERFLQRNPKLSLAAFKDGRLIGTILVAHDGRRGLIHHLAVAASERRQGNGGAIRRATSRCVITALGLGRVWFGSVDPDRFEQILSRPKAQFS